MTLSLKAFAEAVHDLTPLNHNEKVVTFVWYLNDLLGQPRVQPREIIRCYRELALTEPQNLHQHLKHAEEQSPKVILRDRGGLRIEKTARDRLWAKYGDAVRKLQDENAADAAPPGADVAVIVALKEEFSELHVQLPNWEPVLVKETGGFDYTFALTSAEPDRAYRCVATFVGEMTHTPSAIETQRLLQSWRPRTIVNVGIAGSPSGEVGLGDIVVATVVDDYLARGKAVESKTDVGCGSQPGESHIGRAPASRSLPVTFRLPTRVPLNVCAPKPRTI